MDGTLISTEMLHEAVLKLVRRNPLILFCFLAWLVKGRVHLKRQVALRAQIDIASIPYDERVLDWADVQEALKKHPPCRVSEQEPFWLCLLHGRTSSVSPMVLSAARVDVHTQVEA